MTTITFFILIAASYGQTKCDVKKFYKAIETESDVKVLTTFGNLENAEYILVHTNLNQGEYKLSVSRKASNQTSPI
ncbi:MAG TPA: hypothetical protein PK611_01820 [Saprospiraceae bacterium]|nr:hypothetical protein [Saprospiraceae bacterium]HRO08212.1 hypothetical protein [Saprospiraceae bacterium]HRO72387.1 hypothetical protein [Saprospiraceae bacterium]HRP41103.1 hypothetical protein [Saprospiraceae bacterium]